MYKSMILILIRTVSAKINI